MRHGGAPPSFLCRLHGDPLPLSPFWSCLCYVGLCHPLPPTHAYCGEAHHHPPIDGHPLRIAWGGGRSQSRGNTGVREDGCGTYEEEGPPPQWLVSPTEAVTARIVDLAPCMRKPPQNCQGV
jgi:hypothetical protein